MMNNDEILRGVFTYWRHDTLREQAMNVETASWILRNDAGVIDENPCFVSDRGTKLNWNSDTDRMEIDRTS